MIVKELDAPVVSGDASKKAGRAAEEQMAFYLRRAFKEDADTRVLNGLRVEHDGEVAQIDHLVLHPFGLIIVESKSVTTTVRINAHGEWTRWCGGSSRGMPSPVLQAERQRDVLHTLLASREDLHYHDLYGDVVVAISDQGVIQRPRDLDLAAVAKADQVPSHIREQIAFYRLIHSRDKGTGVQGLLSLAFSWLPSEYRATTTFNAAELDRLAAFLAECHRPYQPTTTHGQAPTADTPPRVSGAEPQAARPAQRQTPVAEQQSQPRPPRVYRCCRCGSERVEIAYGYSYYFKCRDCNSNTAINECCTVCGEKQRVRKSGARYFLDCERCATSILYFTDAARAG